MAEDQAAEQAEEQVSDEGAGQTHSPEEAWKDVGRQIEALGESLGRAFRAAWQSEETQRHVRSVETGLEQVAERIDRAVKDASESAEASKVRAEAERTAGSLRQAGEKTWEDMRPQVLSGLRQVEARLNTLIRDLERETEAQEDRDASKAEEGRPRTEGQG